MDNEIWKPIFINHEQSNYAISNIGRIKNVKTNYILKPEVDKDGYLRIALGSKRKHYCVHRLVLLAFVLNLNNAPQVNHINGIKSDNRLENLEWCDCQYNIAHACEAGLRNTKHGETHMWSKYSEAQIIEVCELLQSGNYTVPQVSEITGIPLTHVRGIKSKDHWKYITKRYDFSNVKSDHDKYSKLWRFIDLSILKGYYRKEVVHALMKMGLTKSQATNAFKSRQRKLKHELKELSKIYGEKIF